MSALWLPRTLTEQPQYAAQIDRRNPFGANVYDAVNAAASNTISAIPISANSAGRSFQGNGVSIYQLQAATLTTNPSYTFIVVCQPGVYSTSLYSTIVGRGPKQNGHFELYIDKSGYVNFYEYQTLQSIVLGLNDTTKPSVYAVTRNATTMVGYKNGVLVTSISYAAAGFSGNASVNLEFGENYGSPLLIRPDPGQLNLVAWMSGIYDTAQIATLSANPWQLFKAPPRRLFSVNASPANNLIGISTQDELASATLSQSLAMIAASVQTQTASSALNVGIPLTGQVAQIQSASGALNITIPLNGLAIQQQAGTGAIGISVTFSAVSMQQAMASAILTNAMAGTIALSGKSLQLASASGLIGVAVNLSGNSVTMHSADGTLTSVVPLSGVSAQIHSASGSLIVSANLHGQSLQQQSAFGSIPVSMQINLNGTSLQTAISYASLSMSGKLLPDPQFTVNAHARAFPAKDPTENRIIGFDFTNNLPPGVTLIGTPTFTITVAFDGSDPNVTAMFIGSPQLVGNVAVQMCVAGIAYQSYIIEATCNASNSEILTQGAILPIKPAWNQ